MSHKNPKRTRKSVVDDRWEKKAARGREVKDKFMEQREEEVPPLVALNEKQKRYINLIGSKDLVLATGFAGTSKTYIPTVMACDWYRHNRIKKIVFTRPPISNSKSLGFFGGDLNEKMENWLMPVLSILRDRLTPNVVELAIKRKDIEFVPLETIKGYSAENCMFIVDEAEDISIEEAKKIVTRQGKNCKMILSGDVSQSELKDRSGLKYLIAMVAKHKLDVGVIDFCDVDDIVRSKQCKDWIIAFSKEVS